MAEQYTDIKTILSKFSEIVVKGNHYTKSQVDTKLSGLQSLSDYLTQLDTLGKSADKGFVYKDVTDAGVKSYVLKTDVITQTELNAEIEELQTKINAKQKADAVLATLISLSNAGRKGYLRLVENSTSETKTTLAVVEDPTGIKIIVSKGAADTPKGVTWHDDDETLITGTLEPADADKSAIYFVPNDKGATPNIKDEYVVASEKWELIGSTSVDLTDYAKKDSPTFTGNVILPKTTTIGTGKAGFIKSDGEGNLVVDGEVYQTKTATLTSIIQAVAGATATGLLKITPAEGSSSTGSVSIDTTEYLKKSELSISDEELEAMVDSK